MQLHRAVGDAELARDGLVAAALREVAEDLALARGERGEPVLPAGIRRVALDDPREDARHLRGHDRLSLHHGGERVHEPFRLHVLEKVAPGARAQRRDEVPPVAARGEHDDRGGGVERREPFEHGQPVEAGHAQIEEDDVGLEPGNAPAPLLAVAERRAHLDPPPLQQLAQAASEQRVIVDDHHAEPAAFGRHGMTPAFRRRAPSACRLSGHGTARAPRRGPWERPG